LWSFLGGAVDDGLNESWLPQKRPQVAEVGGLAVYWKTMENSPNLLVKHGEPLVKHDHIVIKPAVFFCVHHRNCLLRAPLF